MRLFNNHYLQQKNIAYKRGFFSKYFQDYLFILKRI